jgi:hypothetical protein
MKVSAKFTFDTTSTGVLACTAYAATVPAFLKDSLEWSITPILGSNLTTIPSPPKGDTIIFRFENLPDSNNQFGVKYIAASLVNYDARDSAMVKTFYEKTATNHPGGITPNWYYYWSQTDANILGNIYGGFFYDPNGGMHGCGVSDTRAWYYFAPDSSQYDPYFHVCDLAADTQQVRGAYPHIDSIFLNGIDAFAISSIHENQHRTDLHNWWGFPPDTTYLDTDLDDIPDHIESTICYDPQNPNVCCDSLNYDSDGDGQWDSEDHALDAEWGNCVICSGLWIDSSADDEDWSKQGHQY